MSAPILSVTVRPLAGESMVSWLNRLAARHRVGLADLLARLDAKPLTRDVREVGYGGIAFAPGQLADVATIVDCTIEQLRALQFDAIADRVLSARWRESQRSCGLEWALTDGSHFCPPCLRERDGGWKLTWKFPWSFACVDHATWLHSACPGCSRRPSDQPSRTGGISRRSLVPRPRHCEAMLREVPGRRIRCGFDFTTALTNPVTDPEVLSAQRCLDRVMRTGDGRVAGQAVPGPDYFVALRAISAVWLSVGLDHDFTIGDPIARAAVAAHIVRRNEIDTARLHHLAGGGAAMSVPKFRYWRTTPDSPGLVAAVAVEAIPIVEHVDDAALARLGERIQAGRNLRDRVVRDCHVPAALAEPLFARSRVARMLTLPGQQLPDVGALQVRHIPTLFWEDLYLEHIRPLFSSGGLCRRRRFASIALARYLTGETWTNSAALTGNTDAADVVAKASALLQSRGMHDAFEATIATLAQQLGEGPLVDYAYRRAAYAAWTIPTADWAQIISKDGASQDTPFCSASAYSWASIVGGSWDDAPCWKDRPTKDERHKHREVIRNRPLRMVLDAYVDAVVRGDRTRFDTLPTPGSERGRRWKRRSLAEARPDLVHEWDNVRNRPDTPETVISRSTRSVWWNCSCGSSWQAPVIQRVWNGASCTPCLLDTGGERRAAA